MAAEFSLRNISIHARKVLLHAVNLRHGTDGLLYYVLCWNCFDKFRRSVAHSFLSPTQLHPTQLWDPLAFKCSACWMWNRPAPPYRTEDEISLQHHVWSYSCWGSLTTCLSVCISVCKVIISLGLKLGPKWLDLVFTQPWVERKVNECELCRRAKGLKA
jgi:hypothetical protein